MSALRSLSLIALVLALTVASVTMAVARHQARAVDEVVLCTGYGMVTVAIDAEGRPTDAMAPCPDCILSLVALGPDGPGVLGPPRRLDAIRHALRDLPAPRSGAPVFRHARAPPVAA